MLPTPPEACSGTIPIRVVVLCVFGEMSSTINYLKTGSNQPTIRVLPRRGLADYHSDPDSETKRNKIDDGK